MRLLVSVLLILAATLMRPSHGAGIETPAAATPAKAYTVRGALLWWCCMESVTVRELPGEVAAAVGDFHSRSKTFRSRLRPPQGRNAPARAVFEKKQALERTVFALFPGQTMAVRAAEFAETVSPAYEWEGASGGPLAEIAGAEKFLSRHPTTPVRPYALLLIAHRSICALDALQYELERDNRDAQAWNLAQQATLRKRLPGALAEAARSSHSLIRFVAAEVERTPACLTEH